VSHLTNTETSLVIWLNSVTIVARSVRLLPAHMREDAHASRQYCNVVNYGVINAMPNMQQSFNAASVHQCRASATDTLAARRCPIHTQLYSPIW